MDQRQPGILVHLPVDAGVQAAPPQTIGVAASTGFE